MRFTERLTPEQCARLVGKCIATAGMVGVLGTAYSATTYNVTNLSLGGSNAYVSAVNESGQATGYAYTANVPGYKAFIFDGTSMQSLGTLGGQYSQGNAINASGQVVGWAYDGSNRQRAFLWNGNAMQDLGTLGGDSSVATAINASGQITGNASTANGGYRAFRRSGSVMEDLGDLGGGYSSGIAINSSGQTAGWSVNQAGYSRSFLSSGGIMQDLGTFGGHSSFPMAMNDNGQVTGYANTSDFSQHAFFWNGSSMQDLGTFGGTNSSGQGINANGQVTGWAHTSSNSAFKAFITNGGVKQDLGTLGGAYSVGYAVNASAQVVGISYGPGNMLAMAFVWSPSEGMIDLNTRLNNAPTGFHVYSARKITDSGFIIADSNTGPVLLTPVQPGPPPTAAAVGPITANDPVAIGTPVNTSVSFTDVNTSDTHTATWTWESNGTTQAVLTENGGTGSATGTRTYTAAGVYNVGVQVTDSSSLSAYSSRQVVVYDPSAGFVTGGGWIMSPTGAYKAEPMLAGKAEFGFVSKYVKGATKPSGNTEFQFQSANLLFQSNNYEWLVVSGARAQYKGTGTINGAGTYKFLLTAVDGAVTGGGGTDRFRIKISHYDEATKTDVVDYDNQIDTGTEGTVNEGTVIGGGSIVIHTKK